MKSVMKQKKIRLLNQKKKKKTWVQVFIIHTPAAQ